MISVELVPEPRSLLFIKHKRMLKAFIRSLIHHPNDVEDILQEVGVCILTGRDEMVDPISFPPWARGVARNLVLHHRRKWRRSQEMLSTRSIDLIEAAYARADIEDDTWKQRRLALELCIERIEPEDRHLLTLRYSGALTSDAIAGQQGRTPVAIRVALLRLRRALLRCVERRLTMAEGHS